MTWMEKQQVICLVGCVALSSDGNNLAVGAKGFGHSVALSSDGDILAVGGWLNDGNGVVMEMVLMQAMHVYFHWNGNAWAQRGGMTWMEKQQVMKVWLGLLRCLQTERLLLWGDFSMMEMVLMQAMHVYSIGMEMPGRYWNGSAWAQRGDDLDGEAAGDEGLVVLVILLRCLPMEQTLAVGAIF
uniref:Uncharacterized protein n=1 Tax=Ditylum brightwellii TaxID=49249 RepID=A0A7S4RYC3_9STRA